MDIGQIKDIVVLVDIDETPAPVEENVVVAPVMEPVKEKVDA